MNQKELHTIAPTLSNLPKKVPFSVPKGYFDSVEELVVTTINLDSLGIKKEQSPFITPSDYFDTVDTFVISRLKAEEALFEEENSIPENYFDTIEDRVFETIQSKKKTIKLKLITKYLAPIAIAASFLFIFILNTTNKTVTFDSLATADIEQFIDYELIDIDTQTLVDTYASVDLENEELSNSISDNDVLEYLYEEDLESIIYEN